MSRNYVSYDDMMEIAQRIRAQRGAANGVAPLDGSGHVPAANLPSYVDDVLEYAAKSAFPATGESGKIYIAADTNMTYRWSGTQYVEISSSLALGETASTAYPGDKGKANATAIANEQTARANADTAINNKIGDMGSLATSAKNTLVAAINEAAKSGGDYSKLSNKPKINNVELSGNKTWAQLGAPITKAVRYFGISPIAVLGGGSYAGNLLVLEFNVPFDQEQILCWRYSTDALLYNYGVSDNGRLKVWLYMIYTNNEPLKIDCWFWILNTK